MEQYRELWESHKDSLDLLAWSSWEGETRFKKLPSGNKSLRLQEFTSNYNDNWCDIGHVGFVLKGELEIDFLDRKVRCSKGSELLINTGLRHQLRSITPKVLLFLVEDNK